MCRNWRTWAVLGGAAIVMAIVLPGARPGVLPLLLLAACPLAMVLMGVGVASAARRTRTGHRPQAPVPDPERVTL